MRKEHYAWWNYIKAVIQAYPGRMGQDLTGVAKREQTAVQAAIEATEGMSGGEARLLVIRLVHLEKTNTLEGAARLVPCGRATAARWRRQFFERVARNLDLLD